MSLNAGHLLENYSRVEVRFVRGEGCELIDDRGVRYLDALSGIAVCALGHAHPAITQAVSEQAARLVHVSNLYYHEPAGELADRLAASSGFERVFFCNSGTEANEAAIKLARKRAFRRGEPNRRTILACSGSFHGRTLGALAATANTEYHEGFGPLPAGFEFTPFNDLAKLDANLNETVAAFIVEPVQGESGVHPADLAFLRAARERCNAVGALLIFDEIQCGMGRLGTTFAFQYFGVRPDLITLAKALANGLPIGALLVDGKVADVLQPGDHGSTFGGSPIPCAAALAHLRVRDELGLNDRVRDRSEQLFCGLRNLSAAHPRLYGEPRGIGLLAGLPIVPPYEAGPIVAGMRDQRVLVGTAGENTIRIAPPLIVGSVAIGQLLRALEHVGLEPIVASERER